MEDVGNYIPPIANPAQDSPQSKKAASRWRDPHFAKKILRYLVVIFVVFIASFGGLHLYQSQPQLLKTLLLNVDPFGVTPAGEAEQSRLAQINQLQITYEEKQVLISRTVFLGATTRMVVLALGEPKEGRRYQDPQKGDVLELIYHFPDDSRPTLLRFENDKLVHAFKGSTIDFPTP